VAGFIQGIHIMFKTHLPSVVLLLATVGLSACGAGNGNGLDANGQPLAEGSTSPQQLVTEPNLKSIQDTVFSPICAACHFGAAAPEGLRLDSEENSFALLVNVQSNQDANYNRVEPGDPDNSYLIQKLEGTALVATRMPLNQPALPDDVIVAICQWISDGALSE
jgi:hypothetical protein